MNALDISSSLGHTPTQGQDQTEITQESPELQRHYPHVRGGKDKKGRPFLTIASLAISQVEVSMQ